jgi:hypothetical protein
MAGVSTVRSSDVILFVAGDFADIFPTAPDCGFDSEEPLRTELDVVSLDGIALCVGLGDGLGAGAL